MSSEEKRLTDYMNDLTYNIIYNRFKNLALNLFEWENLPDGVHERIIEKYLYNEGRVLFFKDELRGFLTLPVFPNGFNVYGEHTNYRVHGFGYENEMPESEGVLIRNNKLMNPTREYIEYYTSKLYEVERTLDLNVKLHKTPFILRGDQSSMITLKNIMRKIQQNIYAIFGDKNFQLDMEVLDLNVDINKITTLKDYNKQLENDVLNFLGINNANTDKKERLITEEVTSNDDFRRMSVDFMYKQRLKACEEINKKFDLNISVKLRGEELEPVHTDIEPNNQE